MAILKTYWSLGRICALVNGAEYEIEEPMDAESVALRTAQRAAFKDYCERESVSGNSQAAADIRKECAARFAKDASWRRRFGAHTDNKEDPYYKAALEKYIRVETKCRADEAKPARTIDNSTEDRSDDVVNKLLRNPNVWAPAGQE